MRVCRLLAFLMFLTLFVCLAAAQSARNEIPGLVSFQGAASLSWSNDDAGQTHALESQVAQSHNGENWRDSAHVDGRASHPGMPSFSLGSESDRTCYFIRDYVVLRDSPHSDSTHRDGSFTCVPGSRFRVYTTGR
jgi:hypothetical protein